LFSEGGSAGKSATKALFWWMVRNGVAKQPDGGVLPNFQIIGNLIPPQAPKTHLWPKLAFAAIGARFSKAKAHATK